MDDKTTKEVGILLEHIRTIDAGENLENARQLPKESLFQEASEQLKNIHLTMQKSPPGLSESDGMLQKISVFRQRLYRYHFNEGR